MLFSSSNNYGKPIYKKIIKKKLKAGDQLAVKTSFSSAWSGEYLNPFLVPFHHGIYVDDEKVIHYVNNSKVYCTNLQEFTGKHAFYRVSYHPDLVPLEPQAVVQRAEHMMKKPTSFNEYCIITNNCEHFAMYCKYGQKISGQVTYYGNRIFKVGLLVFLLITILYLIRAKTKR